MNEVFRRILVVGTTGSGKTTLAHELSTIGKLPHTQLDLLRYQNNWRMAPAPEFIEKVTGVAGDDSWVIDGNYAAVRELIWGRADLVIWLDYSLHVMLYRLLIRTFVRLITSADLGNGNREQLGRVFGRHSVIVWAIRSHRPLRREYELATEVRRPNSLCIVRHRTPGDTRRWLSGVYRADAGNTGTYTSGIRSTIAER